MRPIEPPTGAPPSCSVRSRRRRRLRRLLLAAVIVLYVVSIPWYRQPGAEPALWLGLPDWFALALLAYAGAAVANAAAWALAEFEDPPAPGASGDRPSPAPGETDGPRRRGAGA